MKEKIFLQFLVLFLYLFLYPKAVLALENPLSVPNNKIGIHILFDHELKAASTLVNSQNGDWGYVTIAIQSGDRDVEKWQAFMNSAKQNHVIPIIRLATEGDYFNTRVWRKPTDTDIIDFANFLNSLDWPTKNRYVIVFNEVNRGDEWGGRTNPGEYAQILSFAVTVFKSKSSDYFIIPAGLDNAAPNQPNLFMNEYIYMRLMNQSVPGIFNQVDGLSSHSYPNPGFATPPGVSCATCINSFQYEKALVNTMTPKYLPVFLTETGWSTDVVSDKQAANYFLSALNAVWSDPSIVAITPFLLQGQGGPFQKFSFLNASGSFSEQYQIWKKVPKIKGQPKMAPKVLAAQTKANEENDIAPTPPTRDFSHRPLDKREVFPKQVHDIYKWLIKID